MKEILWTANSMKKQQGVSTNFLSAATVKTVQNFHASFPEYKPTPLRNLSNLANKLGVGGIFVKDESYRFGLNAFKVLGASFAIAKYLAKRLDMDIQDLDFALLRSPAIKKRLGEITFVTATDGNHGRGVAWAARQLQQKAVIYMPKGSSKIRLENIQAEGATASITDLNYDDAVRLAAAKADEFGWVIIQDTDWEGYKDIPEWIMQGYGTIAAEAMEQLPNYNVTKPTHIFLQAGVGSFAGSIAGYFSDYFGEDKPKISVVEADLAACIYQSALAADEAARIVTGDMATIMAGLACGQPNETGWSILRDNGELFFSCPDEVTAHGMRVLGNPIGEDSRIISGESGAVTMGLLSLLLTDPKLQAAKKQLGLDETSQILLISTEGDTDPDAYRKIVWDGLYSNESL